MTNTKKNKAQQITKSDKDHCIWPEGKVQVCKYSRVCSFGC